MAKQTTSPLTLADDGKDIYTWQGENASDGYPYAHSEFRKGIVSELQKKASASVTEASLSSLSSQVATKADSASVNLLSASVANILSTLPAKVDTSTLTDIVSQLDADISDKSVYLRWHYSEAQSMYYLQLFRTQEDADTYDADPDTHSALLRQSLLLPISTVKGDSYVGQLKADTPSGSKLTVKTTDTLPVRLRFFAVHVNGTLGTQDTYNCIGSLIIQRSKDGKTWEDIATQQVTGTDKDSTDYPVALNLMSYLPTENKSVIEGTYYVRASVTFEYESEGIVSKATTSSVMYTISAVNLYVTNLTDWSQRILASDGGFPFSFAVMGAADRQLHVTMTGALGVWTMTPKTFTASEQRPEANPYSWTQAELSAYGLLSHGVHTVTAWLTCSDGKGGELSSDIIVNRYMIVNPSTEGANLAQPYLMLQQVASTVQNYVRSLITSLAVWNPKSADEPTTPSDTPISASILITDYGSTDTDYKSEYYHSESKLLTGEKYDVDTTIEIEGNSDGTTVDSYQAYLRVFRYNGPVQLNFLRESIGSRYIVFDVDNRNNYSPVAGSHFYLDPKVRNNTESVWQTIVNKQTGELIPSTWDGFDGVLDGWVSDDSGVKILRVPAGRDLTIGYEPFEAFLANPSAAMTLEIEFAVRNITAEDMPVINISSFVEATAERLGLWLKPLTGAMFTVGNQNEDDQDFGYEEGERVHMSMVITPALVVKGADELTWQTPSGTPSNRPTAKVYINGKHKRAIQYSVEKAGVWIPDGGHGGIRLGNPDCDLDIYFIRCYRGQALSAQNVLQNYKASRPTAEEKNKLNDDNDILDGYGRISYDKVLAKGKRCLTLYGTEQYKLNQDKNTGYACYIQIDYFDDNGNYVPELSGTLCKSAYLAYVAGALGGKKCLMNTAQGSTAMTYWENNWQIKMDKVTFRIRILFSTVHESYGWSANLSNFSDTAAATNPLFLDGEQIQGDSVASLSEEQLARLEIEVVDGWTDGNGMYRGCFYQVEEGAAKATKLVNKINYASPMQSHKMGATKLYNDVMKATGCIMPHMESNPSARFAVLEQSFYQFYVPNGSTSPVFRGLCTFGQGKCDKPTWGYNKKNMCAFEGLNNNLPLCDFRVPADEDVVYNPDDEAYCYNGVKSLEYSLGATDDAECPTAKNDALIRRYVNFIYTHDIRIKFFDQGGRSAFEQYYTSVFDAATSPSATAEQTEALNEMQTTKFWLNQGGKLLLLRYNYITGAWVDAGSWDDESLSYVSGERNLATDPMTSQAYNSWLSSSDYGDYDSLNSRFKEAIALHFDEHCGAVLHKKNHQVHYSLVNFLLAGTDNCSKNTYYTLDLTTGLVWLFQDDLDTILKTDNNGRQTKVYFLMRLFDLSDTAAGYKKQKDYEGSASALFNVIEHAWEVVDNTALPGVMREILSVMSNLVSSNDNLDGLSVTQRQTPLGCIHKYFFSIQKYFPAVAWNEQQRLRYDWPASWGYESYGNQARGILAVTQGIGDQLESEMQYVKRRLAMVCSYAAWGDFSSGVNTGNTGLEDASGSFSVTPGQGRVGGEYTFELVPHQFIYPCGVRDRALVNPHVRVAPGETYRLTVATAGNSVSGDSSIGLAAINYYRKIGNVGNMVSGNNTITVQGKRLTEFVAEPAAGSTAFAPKQLAFDAANLKHISLRGLTTIAGSLDLRKATRLEKLDLSSTLFAKVDMPAAANLQSAAFGANLTALVLSGMPKLSALTLDGCSNLAKLSLKSIAADTRSIIRSAASQSAPLSSCYIDGVEWSDISASVMSYITYIPDVEIIGVINITRGEVIDSSLKKAMLAKFGNIDSVDNSLYVSYTSRGVTSVGIIAPRVCIAKPGEYSFDLSITPSSANAFSSVEWKIEDNVLNAVIDPKTGILSVPQVGLEEDNPTATISVVLTLLDGSTMSDSVTVKLYNRLPKTGDWAYYDGEFDEVLYPTKEVIGWVYKVTPYSDLPAYLINEYLADDDIKAKYESGAKLYEVIVQSKSNISYKTSDGSVTFSSVAWGIYPEDAGTNGFTADERIAISDATGLTTGQVVDLPDLANYGTRGLINSDGTDKNYMYIRNFNAYDDTQDDGFAVISSGYACGRWDGRKSTASIVVHATKILNDYVASGTLIDSEGNDIWSYITADHVVPQNLTELADLLVALGKLGGSSRYRQLAYPAAMSCKLFEPTTGGQPIKGLSSQYAQGKWYLPAQGDLTRLYIYFRNSRNLTPKDTGSASADYSDENNESRPLEATEARRPHYANLLKRAQTKGVVCPVTMPTTATAWSSTETDSKFSWNVNFYDGYTFSNSKYDSLVVRPVAAYTFEL